MTKLQTWISAERGRASSLAAHLNVSRSRMSQIVDDGVPIKYMVAIRDFTAGEVTLEDMVTSRTQAGGTAAPKEQEATHG
ncbi:YdaS family helix-turn-helix protein [Comamonas sp.]|uniref:YdaS family helix-turn-helix protein n=1 Tax=Comamonas sp. TaxID=34028 RepID=UPI0028A5A2CF|nr:YdaS family helix-turn-helix protein [Comamonas sp.]